MASTINKVNNANVYLDGGTLLGKVMEFTLPDLTSKTSESMPLGQIGTSEHFAGFEKLEGTLKWASLYKEVYLLTANPLSTHQVQLRGNVDVYDATGLVEQVPAVCYLTCTFKKVPFGTFKAHENVELESEISITSVKLEYDGESLVEYDAIANIYKVGGVDVLATYRANLGI
jgi:P2 family phage contractile tail tube protein